MRIPSKYGPVLFGALLSGIMVSVVSAIVILVNQGLVSDFGLRWLKSFATTWPVAFPTVLFVAPLVRRVVGALTYQSELPAKRQ